jgi:hypothetical protein
LVSISDSLILLLDLEEVKVSRRRRKKSLRSEKQISRAEEHLN